MFHFGEPSKQTSTAAKSQKRYHGSSVPQWERDDEPFLPVQSANGVCGRHAAAPSSRLAGTRLERYTCHSPSHERSSELQPWIISSKIQKSFLFLSFFHKRYLYRTKPPSPCNYFNTCSGESKEMEYSSSLSLFNWRKFAKLRSELDIKRRAYVSSHADREPGWQALKGIAGRSWLI